ncbi:MAG: DNA-3-methyladenine glycosylase I [Acidimicrobiia bacterium]
MQKGRDRISTVHRFNVGSARSSQYEARILSRRDGSRHARTGACGPSSSSDFEGEGGSREGFLHSDYHIETTGGGVSKRDFRAVFHNFDLEAVARLDKTKIEELMTNPGIVRNRAKIEATINNARRCLMLIEEEGTLASYLWSREPDVVPKRSTGRPCWT